MGPNGFESCGAWIKIFSDCKSNKSSIVSGEKVFVSRGKFPVVNFMKLCEAASGEFFSTPLDCVVGRDRIVDKLEERLS